MYTLADPIQASLTRQVNHWMQAASRLSALDHLASGNAWYGIDYNLGVLLRKSLLDSVNEVISFGHRISLQIQSADDPEEFRTIKRNVTVLREKYLKAEETILFFTEAINSRTTPSVAALLRACDILCKKSMDELLQPLGKISPPVLTAVIRGIGASILKAGLRLWDGQVSPVAVIKVTHHNLFRPTAIIHETGHQVAHILHWNEELAESLEAELSPHSAAVAAAFGSWSSEIAADAFAFVHAGYGSVAALHDVLCGSVPAMFTWHQHDPHPISYVRLLLNTEMCRQFYGPGPWDVLETAFKNDYDIAGVNFSSVPFIKLCVTAVPDAVAIILKTAYKAFNGSALSGIIRPERVSPGALNELENTAGPALYTSHAWIWKECLRLLALNSFKIGAGLQDARALYKQQEEWMIRLGFAVALN